MVINEKRQLQADVRYICADRDYQASLKTAEQTRAHTTETEFYHSILMHAAHYAVTGYGRRLLLAFLQVGGFFFPGGGMPTEPASTCFWEKLPCGLPMGKIMDVSARHITKGDNALLDNDCHDSLPAVVVFRKDDFGYFVHVPHDDVEESERGMRDAGYSEALIELIRIARNEGASWVCMDSNGPDTEKLPAFDW
jgi:hypothetical protein